MKRILFTFILLVILMAFAAVLAARAAPNYGTCRPYGWNQQVLWIEWLNAPYPADQYQVTFYLKDLRSGEEFLTGAAYSPIVSGGNGYIFFGYDFTGTDWQIRQLTCIARYSNGSTSDITAVGPWRLRWNFLVGVRR